MVTEHTITSEDGGTRREWTRKVFASCDGRILGTETERLHEYRGYDGWTWIENILSTHEFRVPAEASAWLDEMFKQHEIEQVKKSGGPTLVIIT